MNFTIFSNTEKFFFFACFLCCSAAFGRPVDLCIEAIKDTTGFIEKEQFVKKENQSFGVINFTWREEEITCVASKEKVISLDIAGNKLLFEGSSTLNTSKLLNYIDTQTKEEWQACKLRSAAFRDIINKSYIPKINAPSADLLAIKRQFDQNFARVSRKFYIEEYNTSRPKLIRLKKLDKILSALPHEVSENPSCIARADIIFQREQKIQSDLNSAQKEIQKLRIKVKEKETKIKKLYAEVEALEARSLKLLAELRDYDQPRRLKTIMDLIERGDFENAHFSLDQLMRDYVLGNKNLKNLEYLILEKVKPIPASKRKSNFLGYKLLNSIDPNNSYYTSKMETYSD